MKRHKIEFREEKRFLGLTDRHVLLLTFIICLLSFNIGFAYIDYVADCNTAYGDDGRTTGCYEPGNKHIFVFADRVTNSLDQTYFHERCHNYWYTEISDRDRYNYEEIFKKSEYFVSSYAKTDAVEDFASTCAVYTISKAYYNKTPDIDQTRLDFFNDLRPTYNQNIYYIPYSLVTNMKMRLENLSKEIRIV